MLSYYLDLNDGKNSNARISVYDARCIPRIGETIQRHCLDYVVIQVVNVIKHFDDKTDVNKAYSSPPLVIADRIQNPQPRA